MKEESFFNDNYLIWIILNQAREAVFKAREKEVGKFRFPNQAAALIIIWAQAGRATPTLLSRYLFLEHHSASELVSRMETNGLVVKKRDEKHKSVVRISITPKGKSICTRYNGNQVIDELMSSFSEQERADLKRYLTTILNEACRRVGTDAILPSLKEV